MAIVHKFGQWFRIGGVKIEINSDAQFPKMSGTVTGKLTITSKSDQSLEKIELKVAEEYSTGRGKEKKTKTFDLGKVTLPDSAFPIKGSETKTVDFQVPFKILKSTADTLQDKGGALGVLGKAMSFVNAEKSSYFIIAKGAVKGTLRGPRARKPIRLV